MTRQLQIQDDTYHRLEAFKGKLGKRYSFNTVINVLINEWAQNVDDAKYFEIRQRKIVNEMLTKARDEKLIKTINEEFSVLLYLLLAGKFWAAELYLKQKFGSIIKAQKLGKDKKDRSRY